MNEVEIAGPDLASPRFKADPHPFYARLRAEAPVWRTMLSDKRTAWLVTRYADVAGVLKDDRLAKDPHNAQNPEQQAEGQWVPGFLKPLEQNMLDLDDPDHRRLRTLVSKAFTPRLIERLRGRIEEICRELLDSMGRRGRTELARDYALPLPATVIAELLGIPPKDQRRFHRWSSRIVSISSGRDVWRALPAALAFVRYLRKMSERRLSRGAPRLWAGQSVSLSRGAARPDGGPDRHQRPTAALPNPTAGQRARIAALAPGLVPARTTKASPRTEW
jgi:cytochrome P450